jgi:hypothetical protein
MASNSCKGHFALALVSLEDVGPTFRVLRPVAQAGLRNNSCACAGPAGPSQPASQPAPRAQEQGAWREAARARLLSTEPSGSFAVCSASGCRDRAVMWRSGTAPDVSQFRVRPRSLSVGVSASRLQGPRVTLPFLSGEIDREQKKSALPRKPETDESDACARRAEACTTPVGLRGQLCSCGQSQASCSGRGQGTTRL